MRRFVLLAASLLVLAPGAVSAQPRIVVGGGITSPSGGFSDMAGTGYHARAGLEVTIPTLPVSFRADGDAHRLAEATAAFEPTTIIGGALSLVFTLPGVGLGPYLLAGIGQYRLEAGPLGAAVTSDQRGFHGGFGVSLGSAIIEFRYVKVSVEGGDTSYIPLTVGLRL